MRYVRSSKKTKKAGKPAREPPATSAAPPRATALPDRLVAFASPLFRLFPALPSGDLLGSLFSLAMLAWNEGHPAGLLPPREALRLRDRLVHEFGAAWAEIEPVYRELVRSRGAQWAEDRRIITECRVLPGPEGKWELLVLGEER